MKSDEIVKEIFIKQKNWLDRKDNISLNPGYGHKQTQRFV